MGQVVYLTGAPATGKSTICTLIAEQLSNVKCYSYSDLLRQRIEEESSDSVTEAEIRRKSAAIVTPDMVEDLDNWIIEEISSNRDSCHSIVDSHAVTKEDYGFRVTPFTVECLSRFSPTRVICLYAAPEVISERIVANAAGRPKPPLFEIELHLNLQASLALQYSLSLGIPLYCIDSSRSLTEVVQSVIELGRLAH